MYLKHSLSVFRALNLHYVGVLRGGPDAVNREAFEVEGGGGRGVGGGGGSKRRVRPYN